MMTLDLKRTCAPAPKRGHRRLCVNFRRGSAPRQNDTSATPNGSYGTPYIDPTHDLMQGIQVKRGFFYHRRRKFE
jgi:hypothetical protein